MQDEGNTEASCDNPPRSAPWLKPNPKIHLQKKKKKLIKLKINKCDEIKSHTINLLQERMRKMT